MEPEAQPADLLDEPLDLFGKSTYTKAHSKSREKLVSDWEIKARKIIKKKS